MFNLIFILFSETRFWM